ncbi:MAG: acyltransferase family protein [Eubacterium sp.]
MEETKQINRIQAIDISKGIGIICVVILHSIPAQSPLYNVFVTFVMPLFFFLSGAVIKEVNSKIDIYDFFRKNLKLLINYFVCSGIYLVLEFFVEFLLLKSIDFTSFAVDIAATVLMSGINVLWFFSALLGGKFLCVYILGKSKKAVLNIAIGCISMAGALIIAMALQSLPESGIMRVVHLLCQTVIRPFFVMIYIMAGYYSKKILRLLIEMNKKIINTIPIFCMGAALIVLIAFMGQPVINNIKNLDFVHIPEMIICSFAGTIGVVLISIVLSKFKGVSKVLSYFGLNSLFIMIVHDQINIQRLGRFLAEKITSDTYLMYTLKSVFVLAVCVIMTALLAKPYNKLINTINGKIITLTERKRKASE